MLIPENNLKPPVVTLASYRGFYNSIQYSVVMREKKSDGERKIETEGGTERYRGQGREINRARVTEYKKTRENESSLGEKCTYFNMYSCMFSLVLCVLVVCPVCPRRYVLCVLVVCRVCPLSGLQCVAAIVVALLSLTISLV